jgi:hypothetical protein
MRALDLLKDSTSEGGPQSISTISRLHPGNARPGPDADVTVHHPEECVACCGPSGGSRLKGSFTMSPLAVHVRIWFQHFTAMRNAPPVAGSPVMSIAVAWTGGRASDPERKLTIDGRVGSERARTSYAHRRRLALLLAGKAAVRPAAICRVKAIVGRICRRRQHGG